MKAVESQRTPSGWRVLAPGLAVIACLALLPAGAASANTFADACGATSDHELRRALGQSDSRKHSSVLRAPGNSAGVLHLRCTVLAWSGRQPFGAKQERRQIAAGKAAVLRMETWVPDEGSAAEVWRQNFAAKIKGLVSAARRQFAGPGHGTIALSTLGAEHSLGLKRISPAFVKVRALWWSASASSIVSMNLLEAKGEPIGSSIRQIARSVVPEIH